MLKNRKSLVLFTLFAVQIFALQACSSLPINLRLAKNAVLKYHSSGQYDKDMNSIISGAMDDFSDIKGSGKNAVVFDVDETTLSNYELNKRLDFGYIKEAWDRWIAEAKAPAVKQTKELYDYLLSKGIKIIFITGRYDKDYEPTLLNLHRAGYTIIDTLITRSPETSNETAQDYKSAERVKLTQIGYNIVGTVGDQYSDLDGPYHGIQVKLPNYQYLIK